MDSDEVLQLYNTNHINQEYLIKLTGNTNLNEIEYLSLKIDCNYQSLIDLSYYLPNLKSLILDQSNIISLRNFGLNYKNTLLTLSIRECDIYDLDGISCLSRLIELDMSDNFISDISPLSALEDLQVRYI